MFGTEESSLVCNPEMQAQIGGTDCGLFVIVHMTSIAYRDDPSVISYDQIKMRDHLIECFIKGNGSLFPFHIVTDSEIGLSTIRYICVEAVLLARKNHYT